MDPPTTDPNSVELEPTELPLTSAYGVVYCWPCISLLRRMRGVGWSLLHPASLWPATHKVSRVKCSKRVHTSVMCVDCGVYSPVTTPFYFTPSSSSITIYRAPASRGQG